MVAKVERKCKCCGEPFMARTADVKRGWGRFCSKQYKAIIQEKKTGQYKQYLARQENDDVEWAIHWSEF